MAITITWIILLIVLIINTSLTAIKPEPIANKTLHTIKVIVIAINWCLLSIHIIN